MGKRFPMKCKTVTKRFLSSAEKPLWMLLDQESLQVVTMKTSNFQAGGKGDFASCTYMLGLSWLHFCCHYDR